MTKRRVIVSVALILLITVVIFLVARGTTPRLDPPGWYEWDGPLNWPLSPTV